MKCLSILICQKEENVFVFHNIYDVNMSIHIWYIRHVPASQTIRSHSTGTRHSSGSTLLGRISPGPVGAFGRKERYYKSGGYLLVGNCHRWIGIKTQMLHGIFTYIYPKMRPNIPWSIWEEGFTMVSTIGSTRRWRSLGTHHGNGLGKIPQFRYGPQWCTSVYMFGYTKGLQYLEGKIKTP